MKQSVIAKASRINFLNAPIDALSMSETLKKIEEFVHSKRPHQHMAVNVAKIVNLHQDQALYDSVVQSDLINADGLPIVWAARFLGKVIPERVAGIDLMQELIKLSAEKGYRPYFLGAKEEVVKAVVEIAQKKYPALQVAGYTNGYCFQNGGERKIVENIKNSRADILFVALGSPQKEIFIKKYLQEMQVPFCMGVGGSFDVVAGVTKRAPRWMQKSGLEWFYRFIQEPRRMWKRYLVTNSLFIYYVLKEKIRLVCL
ncbi:MAG: WecB/TagA/CpsF family glycosyltransferase [Candidatus Schekmanbacteria bacterium]|nr:WecB/TagA/CpsF family glycosyltransferase [Candidatus Schekmanbacteria bacterium]